eukprot:TRINITY_DN106612_c0_g1_i1.p1 TRINITY_DN106612_c0_g1~~TRINITY_DN106612_c0_g1_i1.p1  ORF type:complete len:497 (-),score=75.48 TRINITY_DN106612_c0_g1_i1:84-1574(-)
MTEFKRTTQAVEEVELLVQSLLDAGSSSADLQRLGKLVGETTPVVEKLSRKAAETDPNKQTYGPAMRDKVKALAEKWATVGSLARDVLHQRGGAVIEPAESLSGGPPPPAPAPSTGSVLWQPPRAASSSANAASASSAASGETTSGSMPLSGGTTGGSTPANNEERRRRAAAAAEARLSGTGSGQSQPAASSQVGSSNAAHSATAASSSSSSGANPQPMPIVARMDALLHLVHCVFLGHGFSSTQAGSETGAGPFRLRYTHESRPAICVTYVPVQRHLMAYASLEDAPEAPAKAGVQVGMPAAAVQAKIDYLLLYPILYRRCLPALPDIPPETLFLLLCNFAIPSLAKAGTTCRALSAGIFDNDLLWYRVVLALPPSPQLAAALESAQEAEKRGEVLPRGAYRRMARDEVRSARERAEEMRRRHEAEQAMQRRLRDPLMVQPPRRPQFPSGPGFPGMIGGPHDIMPGGGFGPLGGGRMDPFGNGRRGPFGGGGGLF